MRKDYCWINNNRMFSNKKSKFVRFMITFSQNSPHIKSTKINSRLNTSIHCQPRTLIASSTDMKELLVIKKRSYPPSRTFTKSKKHQNPYWFTTAQKIQSMWGQSYQVNKKDIWGQSSKDNKKGVWAQSYKLNKKDIQAYSHKVNKNGKLMSSHSLVAQLPKILKLQR